MRLESALYSGKQGLDSHGQALAVVGDNISNSNTTGFRESRAEFSDILAEGIDGASSIVVSGAGGGSMISKVRTIQQTGVIEPTERALDVAIEGEGFFMVGDVAAPAYSRAGNFNIGEDGLLKNAQNENVLGLQGDTTTLGPLDMYSATATATATTTAAIAGNLDAASTLKAVPGTLPGTFRELTESASYTSDVTVYDSLGNARNITLAYFHESANTWSARAYANGGDTGGTTGVPVEIGKATLNFETNGRISDASAADAVLTATTAFSGAAPGSIAFDLSSYSQYSGSSDMRSLVQDGTSAGSIKSYAVDSSGVVYALLDNSERAKIGTIQLRTFKNVDSLERSGSANFIATSNEGALDPGSPGTGVLGQVRGGSLERSTVDTANQFVNLVLYQRGYQASSQTITAVNELLQQTLGLLR